MANSEYTRNQHYIPKFLLKRFSTLINPSAKKKNREHYAYVGYRSGVVEFIEVDNFAVEQDFHETSDLESNFIEKKLSFDESKQASTIERILEEQRVHKSQWKNLSNFALQLMLRTRGFRVNSSHITESVFKNKAKIPIHTGKELDIEITKTLCEFMWAKQSRAPTAEEISLVLPKARKEYADKIFPKTQKAINNIDFRCLGRDMSIKGLVRNHKGTVNRYSNYKWRLKSTKEELLLGDNCLLAYSKNVKGFVLPFLERETIISYVVLPIDSYHYLLGQNINKEGNFSLPSASDLNDSNVILSNSFVVAKSEAVLAKTNLDLIGSSSSLDTIRHL